MAQLTTTAPAIAPKLTISATVDVIKAMGLSCRYDSQWKEYRVNRIGHGTESAYFTSDPHDAIATAQAMVKQYQLAPCHGLFNPSTVMDMAPKAAKVIISANLLADTNVPLELEIPASALVAALARLPDTRLIHVSVTNTGAMFVGT